MSYLGDYAAGDIVDFKFTTRRFSTGAPYTLGGTPALGVYKSNSDTQSTSGVTLTVDFDSVTGMNHVRVDTSSDGTFYADGSQFSVVITTGTVDSVSVVGEVVGRFTLRAQASLYPTTKARTLDVSAGGEAGVDWSNVGSPTTTVDLSGTTISTAQAVASVSGAVGSVTGNVGGNVAGSVGSVTGLNPALVDVAISTRATPAEILTTALTEAYRANGAEGTLTQILYEIIAHLGESSIAGTTKTINKIDHTAPAETFTLDSATAPTSITRAS